MSERAARVARKSYRDVAWESNPEDGVLLRAESDDGATISVRDGEGGEYGWSVERGDEVVKSGKSPSLIDAKLDAVDAAKGMGTVSEKASADRANALQFAEFTPAERDAISAKVSKLVGEGMSQDQAVAIAIKTVAPEKSTSEKAAAKYGSTLSSLACEMLQSIQDAGGSAKHEHPKDSPEDKAMDELVNASAVTRKSDGSVTITEAGKRLLTDPTEYAEGAERQYVVNWQTMGKGARATIGDITIAVLTPFESSPNVWSWVVKEAGLIKGSGDAASLGAAKSEAEARAKSVSEEFSDARAYADRTLQITSIERALLEKIHVDGKGHPEPDTEVTYLALAAKKLIEMDESGAYHVTDAGKEALGDAEYKGGVKYAESDARQYAAAWKSDPGLGVPNGKGGFTATIGDLLLMVWDYRYFWAWRVDKNYPGEGRDTVKSGQAASADASKSAAEAAARSMGAKFSEFRQYAAEKWRQETSGGWTPADIGDFRLMANVDGRWSVEDVTKAGGDVKSGKASDLASAQSAAESAARAIGAKFSDASQRDYAAVSLNDIEVKPHPSAPGTHSIATVQVGGRVFGVSWAGKPTKEKVLEAWKTDRKSFKPYNESTGRFMRAGSYADPASYASVTSQSPRIPTGEYLAVLDPETGTYTVKDVPIFAEHKVPDAHFRIGERWMRAAVKKARTRMMSDKYVAPLHIRHHGDEKGTERAGYVIPTDVRQATYEGRPTWFLYADLTGIPEEVYEKIKRRELPYRSVEINDVKNPEISSLALLEDEVPYFRLPILGVGKEVEAKQGARPIAASARRVSGAWAAKTPCLAYAQRRGRVSVMYSEASMAKAVGAARKYAAWQQVEGGGWKAKSSDGDMISVTPTAGGFHWTVMKLTGGAKNGDATTADAAKSAAEAAARSMGLKFSNEENTMRKKNAARKYMAPSVDEDEDDKMKYTTVDQWKTPDGKYLVTIHGDNSWSIVDRSTNAAVKTGPGGMGGAKAALKSLGNYAADDVPPLDDDEKKKAMRARYMTPDEDDEKKKALKAAALAYAEAGPDDDEEKMRALRLADAAVTGETGPDAKPGSPGGQAGGAETQMRMFAEMAGYMKQMAADNRAMRRYMKRAWEITDDEDDSDSAKMADPGDLTEDDEDAPVEMKASAALMGRLAMVEGELKSAKAERATEGAIKAALRELQGYELGDDNEAYLRTLAKKNGANSIRLYVDFVKRNGKKDPTGDDLADIEGGSLDGLPDEVLRYREKGPGKLEQAMKHYSDYSDLRSRGMMRMKLADYLNAQFDFVPVNESGNGTAE